MAAPKHHTKRTCTDEVCPICHPEAARLARRRRRMTDEERQAEALAELELHQEPGGWSW